ncbi:unnamed protein product [Caenorhabditis angaria]|uniref:Uncharacterized protein n=1 Tax=Caenorhabditis angaria TaxID=860376 RepID=A0A9P1J526_9PELO|nr:unnamed protein product [Caenorhabditis angaria]
MNRFLVFAIFILCSFMTCDALRGALFRSGRSAGRSRPMNQQSAQTLFDYMFAPKRSVGTLESESVVPELPSDEQQPLFYTQFH